MEWYWYVIIVLIIVLALTLGAARWAIRSLVGFIAGIWLLGNFGKRGR